MDPLIFHDNAYGGDGTAHVARTLAELNRGERARLQKLGAALERARHAGDVETYSATLTTCLLLVFPTLTAERLRSIPLPSRNELMHWWNQRQPRSPRVRRGRAA